IRFRSQALLMREKGMGLADIGDIVSRDEHTITRWLKEWSEIRLASLFTGHKGNENASKLTKEQRQEIKDTLQKPPSSLGLPKAFWDVPALKTYVEARFDTVYESERSYHFLLKFSDLSFKYPDTFDRRRDKTKIEERIIEIREEIKPLLADPSWEVFASDEVRIELEALTRRAWLRRGERTIIKVDRKREAQSYIGLLNQKTFICHTYEMPWQNQQEVLQALELFLAEYPDKKICIVWDNATFHKGKEIRKALTSGGILDRVHLIALPPYAPDYNPIEHVWNGAKGAIANIQRDTLSATKAAFVEHIDGRKFEYRI
ncbi:MAG: IS630 family transposase, partial [Rectinemataceae bacterium]|nr:IS630 family transposase [Rectinemataceae bacterium]